MQRCSLRVWRRWLALVLAALTLTAGCAGPGARPEGTDAGTQALEKRVSELESELSAARKAAERKEAITLYFVRNLPTEMRLVPEVREVGWQADMPKAGLEELIKGPEDKDLDSLIPRETKVLDVSVRNFIAYANFSPEITRMSVGSTGEALVIAAIANTLIKFPGVEKVQILVDGQKVESLAGHVDVTEPVGRNERFLLLPEAK